MTIYSSKILNRDYIIAKQSHYFNIFLPAHFNLFLTTKKIRAIMVTVVGIIWNKYQSRVGSSLLLVCLFQQRYDFKSIGITGFCVFDLSFSWKSRLLGKFMDTSGLWYKYIIYIKLRLSELKKFDLLCQ